MVLIAIIQDREMINWRPILAVFIVALMVAGCTATELRNSLHVGGKVVYDSLKNIGENARRDGH